MRTYSLIFVNYSEPGALALVFVETKKGADLLANYLSRLQFPVAAIHGDRPQADRERALSSFRSGRTPVLIATAVAARGLDIPNVKVRQSPPSIISCQRISFPVIGFYWLISVGTATGTHSVD